MFSVLGGLQQVFPEGPPSVDFAIDSGVWMGIVYILLILIRYLSIHLSMDGYRLHLIDSDTILINTFIHRDPIEKTIL